MYVCIRKPIQVRGEQMNDPCAGLDGTRISNLANRGLEVARKRTLLDNSGNPRERTVPNYHTEFGTLARIISVVFRGLDVASRRKFFVV